MKAEFTERAGRLWDALGGCDEFAAIATIAYDIEAAVASERWQIIQMLEAQPHACTKDAHMLEALTQHIRERGGK